MTGERVFSPTLGLFAVAAASVLGYAGWLRLREPDFPGCVRALADGDLEGGERRRLLARLVQVADSGRPIERVASSLAAIALEDLEGFRARAGARVGELPAIAAVVANLDAADRDTAAFGDDVLRRLLEAFADEVAGRRAEARARYEQLAQSARLFRMTGAAELCGEGLARTR